MRFCFLLVFLMIFDPIAPEALVWKNRLVIFSGPDSASEWDSPTLKKDLEERKLLYFFFEGDKLMRSNYQGEIDPRAFQTKLGKRIVGESKWVLIGLDGGIKSTGKMKPEVSAVLRIIDAMPMRQTER